MYPIALARSTERVERQSVQFVRACRTYLIFHIVLLTGVFALSAYFPDYSHGCSQPQRNKNDSRNCFGFTSADLS